MKVYLVCRSWADGCGDFGWEIVKAFFAKKPAINYCMELELNRERYSNEEYYVDLLEVN